MLSLVEHEKSFITSEPRFKLFDADGIPEIIFENFNFEKNQQTTIKHAELPSMQKKNCMCLDKKVYLKIIFLISQTKHMLWVLKRTVSMRRIFWAPKTHV